jgi:prepilin-type N-terminal cleavage/methylation domain-containing protein
MPSQPRRRSEAGFSLAEVMLALAILSVVLIALGTLMFQVAQHAEDSAAVGYRSAAAASAASWVQGLPWDSIDGAVGCRTDSTGQLVYVRCTSVQVLPSQHKRVTIVINPTGRLVARPETVTVERRPSLTLSPFRVN